MSEPRRAALPLLDHILETARRAQMLSVAVAVHDYASEVQFAYGAARVFHAASTIKLAVLLALLKAAEDGRVRLGERLHVRNRFQSQADGTPFFLQADRDGDPDLYKAVGRTASLHALAETMIVRSSNLATNLLIEHLGVATIAAVLAEAGLDALRCLRGVEDEAAFSQGLNNQVTAEGLLKLFRALHEAKSLRPESRDRFFEILLQQRFNGMIPAGLPESAKARVAHKTGEISTVCHDAGMVFLPGRAPYILVVLTEYASGGATAPRNRAVASISGAVFAFLKDAADLHLAAPTP